MMRVIIVMPIFWVEIRKSFAPMMMESLLQLQENLFWDSAGKPILGQLYSNDVTNILIVVVRYFGGKKLGASGLIVAYKTAAADALEHAKIVPHIVKQELSVRCSFAEVDLVMRITKNEF